MKDLDSKYVSELEAIKSEIQESEELSAYLEEEGEEEYKALINKFESRIHTIYEKVATDDPLQIIAFELQLLDEGFEGLYLSKLLGYTVLRGKLNDDFKYSRPQDHFKKVLDFIVHSSNFEQIKLRVGQSIQIGFALSSDIWITNLINSISNKRVKSFLESQNLLRNHDIRVRRTAYVKYIKQFQSLNFYTALFPNTKQEFIREYQLLKSFLLYRAKEFSDKNENFHGELSKFLSSHQSYGYTPNYYEILLIIGLHYDLTSDEVNLVKSIINKWRDSDSNFENSFFSILLKIWNEVSPSADEEKRLIPLIDTSSNDVVSQFYKTLNLVHSEGYINENAINSVREFYYSNEGLSAQNHCIRNTIFKYYSGLLQTLEVGDYADYFEINKTISQYINIFDNQQFNQNVKDVTVKYIKKLLKHYTDKRGKDYQDIKRFVWASFVDLNFMSEKQLKEFFKTKRKAKPTT